MDLRAKNFLHHTTARRLHSNMREIQMRRRRHEGPSGQHPGPADPKTSRPRIQRYTKPGVLVCVRTLFVTLPSTTADSPPRPCDAMTMRSQPLSEVAAIMA